MDQKDTPLVVVCHKDLLQDARVLQLVGVLHVEEERKLDLHVELELLGDQVVVLIWVAVVVAFLEVASLPLEEGQAAALGVVHLVGSLEVYPILDEEVVLLDL